MLQVVSLVLVLVLMLMVPLLVVLASVKLQVLHVLQVLQVLLARPNPKALQGWLVWVFLAAWHQAQARL
jgi:hypothetical protein